MARRCRVVTPDVVCSGRPRGALRRLGTGTGGSEEAGLRGLLDAGLFSRPLEDVDLAEDAIIPGTDHHPPLPHAAQAFHNAGTRDPGNLLQGRIQKDRELAAAPLDEPEILVPHRSRAGLRAE